MFPVHPTDKTQNNSNISSISHSTSPSIHTAALVNNNSSCCTSSPATPTTTTRGARGHGRKLSHVQFGKKPYIQSDEYASSTLMISFGDLKNQKLPLGSVSASAALKERGDTEATLINNNKSTLVQDTTLNTAKRSKRRRFFNWLFSTDNIGPFTKGKQWPLFTYLIVAFTIVIFSGELLLSRQSSGEFFELEPINVMLGPSIEILIQAGARFPPCMRHVDAMSFDQRYICLHTIQQNTLTAEAIATANSHNSSSSNNNLVAAANHQLRLLEPIVNNNLQQEDPSFFNATCSLSTLCGMTAFHQHGQPDQTFRFLTPLFIHTGLVHLCINMAVIVLLGVKVERAINSLRFSLIYIGSGIFGHALGANVAPSTTPFLGCSSSLFGIIGYLYVDLLLNRKILKQPIVNIIKLVVCTALSFILGLLPGVDTFSHIGGLIAGILLGLFLIPAKWWFNTKETTRKKKKLMIGLYVMRGLSVCIYAILLAVLVYQFSVSKLDDVCPYCKYISCLPINGFCD